MYIMSEEAVTKAILSSLIKNGWNIVCFDFPQSGTGILLHPDSSGNNKNKGAINPDIIAVKNEIGMYFENKDRTYLPDFQKVNLLRTQNCYINALTNLLKQFSIKYMYYGIGLPSQKCTQSALDNKNLVDFIIGVNPDTTIQFIYNKNPNQLIL